MTGPDLSGEGELRYGDSTLPIPGGLLTGATLISPRIPSVVLGPREIIERALDVPLDLPPLSRIVKAGEKVAIAVPDVTRYCGSEIYLPIIVEKLEEAGILRRDISFFVALGIHRELTEDELDSVTGGLSREVSTFQHDPDSNLSDLGNTPMGTPVHVNADLLTYDRIIATGTVSFHYFAGFGGGRKVIVPGLAGRETCHATHFRVFGEGKGKHPRAKSGVLTGNPVHEDMTEAAGKVTVDFCLNTCITPEKVLFEAFGGSLLQSFVAACSHYARFFRMDLPERLPFVIASAGGYPKDINFIQSHKALDNAFQAVTEGGVIILVAECRDGFGHPGFFPWFRFEDLDAFEDHLRQNYFIYGQTAHSVLYKARKVKVILVSELDSDDVRGMSMEAAHDLDDAISKARVHLGDIDRFYLIPDAGYVLPQCE
jgi:nickel-dependent lactate racemase